MMAKLFNRKKKMKKEEINTTEEQTTEAQEDVNAQQEEVQNDEQDVKAETAEEPKEITIEEKLEMAEAEIADLKNQMLYKQAEFDNYRKRTMKERAELILNGGAKTIEALLPVLDDMERAVANQDKTDDIDAVREGITLVLKKFQKTLESLGVKEIETTDAEFNTDLHEAIALVPGMGEDKKNKVIDCMQKGYKLNDKVIRFAKVAVGQ